VSSLPRQDEHETLETLFQNVDLSIAETQARQCFHTTGPGRPPRSPLGLLRAFIVMRMKEIRSLRELTRILNVDQRIRRLCLIEDGERGYPRSVLSRFTRRVGAERLRRRARDAAEWEIAGLLHDLDYDLVQDDPSQHGIKTAALLDGKISKEILQAIMAHDHRTGQKVATLLGRALIFSDSLAILIEDQSLDHDSDEEEIAEAISLEAMKKPWIAQNIEHFCLEIDLDSRALLRVILQVI
jgi:hypothetical protein